MTALAGAVILAAIGCVFAALHLRRWAIAALAAGTAWAYLGALLAYMADEGLAAVLAAVTGLLAGLSAELHRRAAEDATVLPLRRRRRGRHGRRRPPT